MAKASCNSIEAFRSWLKEKLVDLNTDDEVFSPYILGILEDGDTNEEKSDALLGILSEITENDTIDLCTEILKKWSETLEGVIEDKKNTAKVNVDEKLVKLMGETKLQPLQVVPTISTEQQKLKEAILAQYSQVSDVGVSNVDQENSTPVVCSTSCITKNMNADIVAKSERDKRQKDKEEAQRKKEKDKENKAKQKTKEEERKEKEKKRTQKGERRR